MTDRHTLNSPAGTMVRAAFVATVHRPMSIAILIEKVTACVSGGNVCPDINGPHHWKHIDHPWPRQLLANPRVWGGRRRSITNTYRMSQ